jgi:hypothetical protein
MIRTRDFLLFSGTLVFLLSAITITVVTDAMGNGGSQVASVANFAPPSAVMGAESPEQTDSREANINRLKGKIAAGEGDIPAGPPIFTSVIEPVTDTDTVITDQTAPSSILIGQTMDGQPLRSDDLWRFLGFGMNDQIGEALNGSPIFGSRPDGLALDACGGVDEGFGYRLYFQPAKPIDPTCFGA